MSRVSFVITTGPTVIVKLVFTSCLCRVIQGPRLRPQRGRNPRCLPETWEAVTVGVFVSPPLLNMLSASL